MTNIEIRMTKEARKQKAENPTNSCFGFHSSLGVSAFEFA